MTKTVKAFLALLIAIIAAAAFAAISYTMPKWVKDTLFLLSSLPLLIYGLGKYFAWCWKYWTRWRRQTGDDAAGGA